MTETDWLECKNPNPMLEFLRGKVSDRRLRLFACACCRQFPECLGIDAIRTAINTNEKFSDQQASEKELSLARSSAHNAAWNARNVNVSTPIEGDSRLWSIRTDTGISNVFLSRLYFVAFMASSTPRLQVDKMPLLGTDTTLSRLGPLLIREIFGNPFRPLSIHSNWLTPTVTNLASAAYEQRCLPSGELDTARLAILADALEDAGCDYADILGHLRSPGPHFRGCHGIDLLLGKE